LDLSQPAIYSSYISIILRADSYDLVPLTISFDVFSSDLSSSDLSSSDGLSKSPSSVSSVNKYYENDKNLVDSFFSCFSDSSAFLNSSYALVNLSFFFKSI
jgi:hypothetical protein